MGGGWSPEPALLGLLFFGFFATTGFGLTGSTGIGTGFTWISVMAAAGGEMSIGPCPQSSAGTRPAPIATASNKRERVMARWPGGVFVAHLLLGTHQDNASDMVAKGRSHGKLHPVEALLAVIHDAPVDEIAETLGVATYSIRQIQKGKRHSELTGIKPP